MSSTLVLTLEIIILENGFIPVFKAVKRICDHILNPIGLLSSQIKADKDRGVAVIRANNNTLNILKQLKKRILNVLTTRSGVRDDRYAN